MRLGIVLRLETLGTSTEGIFGIAECGELRSIEVEGVLWGEYGVGPPLRPRRWAGRRPWAAARPTGAQRVAMARRHIEKGVPLLEISRARGVSRAALEKWVRVARARGYAALRGPRGGKGKEASPMGRPKKRAPQTPLEQLKHENAQLRAELALLKNSEP